MKPIFLLDENIPMRVTEVMRKKGYKVYHVNDFRRYGKGMTDQALKEMAEDNNIVIITQDKRFSEPRKGGDRVLIQPITNVSSVRVIMKRIKELGW